MWYTPVSGIWQTVWLESLPERPIEKIKITSTTKNAKIEIKSEAEKKVLTMPDGERIEFTDDVIVISPKNPHPWSPEDPYLYRFTLETETDKIESYFALREIGISEVDGISRLTLNGKPYIFNGLLDQGYFPDGIFLPASSDGYADDIKTAKACGFNMLRKHIKIEPQIFYYLCDTLGIAVFQDMVNNSDYSFLRDTALPTVGLQKLPDKMLHRSKESREIFVKAMTEEAELLYNCPSILYYTIFNEGWGQFSSDEVYRTLESLDPTRIIDSTSGWFRRKKSDVDSRHIYFKPLNPKKPDGRPLVISEFGGYSYRCCGPQFAVIYRGDVVLCGSLVILLVQNHGVALTNLLQLLVQLGLANLHHRLLDGDAVKALNLDGGENVVSNRKSQVLCHVQHRHLIHGGLCVGQWLLLYGLKNISQRLFNQV